MVRCIMQRHTSTCLLQAVHVQPNKNDSSLDNDDVDDAGDGGGYVDADVDGDESDDGEAQRL